MEMYAGNSYYVQDLESKGYTVTINYSQVDNQKYLKCKSGSDVFQLLRYFTRVPIEIFTNTTLLVRIHGVELFTKVSINYILKQNSAISHSSFKSSLTEFTFRRMEFHICILGLPEQESSRNGTRDGHDHRVEGSHSACAFPSEGKSRGLHSK